MSSVNNISQDFFNNTFNNLGTNPFVLVVLIVVILIYYILFAFLGKVSGGSGNDMDSPSNSGGFVFIEAILWGLFIVLIFFNGISYFFGVNLITEISKLTSKEPEITITKTKDKNIITEEEKIKKQDSTNEVFHVPGERFTYHDAKAVCKAFDSDMATFQQLNDAQKTGANWCSYGWSNEQLGIYPTSQTMWDKLQKNDDHKHDCGLPGINGGFVADPYVKMGANCYGVKPKQSDLEKQMSDITDDGIPKTAKEILFDKRVYYWKNRVGNILISPFNNSSWFKS